MPHEPINLLELDPYIAIQQPLAAKGDERFKQLLAWAQLSPSPHNTQPWKWFVKEDVVRLYADYSRRLEVCDPDARELVIGCGSSLEHYLLRLGLDNEPINIELLPDRNQPELLAQIVIGRGKPYAHHPDLVDAMQRRRTNRTVYHGNPMPEETRAQLKQACAEFDVQALWVSQPSIRASLVELIMGSDRVQMASTAFRKELSQWMRVGKSTGTDGIPTSLLGQHGVAAYVAPLVVRTFDVGAMQAAADSKLTEGSPDIVVLTTKSDATDSWLATGRALARFTLGAMAVGRYSAYMNQPCEVPASRKQLANLLQTNGFPQLVIRMGLASPVERAPRRPVVDVLRGMTEPQ
jgi:nitroreductase